MQINETEVLVVGAGPVGLTTALLLAESGVRIKIIDQGWRAATHSYASVLHPSALRLLARMGLLESVLEQGRRIDMIGLYDGKRRRAELNLSLLPGPNAFVVSLPQSSLETLLEHQLAQRFQIKVDWNHRLAGLGFNKTGTVSCVESLRHEARNAVLPAWDWTVQKEMEIKAEFVVGADGHDSMVRRRLGFDYEVMGEPEVYSIFEFETQADPGSEARIVVDDKTTNVLWPLPGNRCRWSFQGIPENAEEFLHKDRDTAHLMPAEIDELRRNYVTGLARARAPWFQEKIKRLHWSARICFQSGLAAHFGKGRAWLAGDAAHQTKPIGVQSLNAGICEAEDLAGKLASILRGAASLRSLESYGSGHRKSWKNLIAMTTSESPVKRKNGWAAANRARILACLPATGEDLASLANQLGLSA